jgi:hypothetical protein
LRKELFGRCGPLLRSGGIPQKLADSQSRLTTGSKPF